MTSTISNESPGNVISNSIFGTAMPPEETVTVVTFLPTADDQAPTTTWYIKSNTSVEYYMTWTPGATTASAVLHTITPGSQSASETKATTDATASPATSESTGQTSSTTATTSRTNTLATPSASSTQTPRVESSDSDSGIGTGSLAGAIVGSVVGTAILTFLLAFLFFRRRRTGQVFGPVENVAPSPTKAGAFVSTSVCSSEKPDGSFSLAAITPHPADDETVRSKILTLIDYATLHVENYYASTSHIQLSQDAVARLSNYDSDYLPSPLVIVLEQQGFQRQAITHALVYALLRAIGAGGQLLPQLLAGQPHADTIPTSMGNVLFAWRMITAHLYDQSSQNRHATIATVRNQAARAFADEFSSAFSAYAQPAVSESDRVVHLTKVANSAAELGRWLFAQPCSIDFVWEKSSSEITVSPKVAKTSDERGTRLAVPQVLIEPVQARYPVAV